MLFGVGISRNSFLARLRAFLPITKPSRRLTKCAVPPYGVVHNHIELGRVFVILVVENEFHTRLVTVESLVDAYFRVL